MASSKKKATTKKSSRSTATKKKVKKTASTKKTVKKAVKKTAKKRAEPKKKDDTLHVEVIMEHPIKADAHPDKCFVLVDGKRLKNIKELADVMEDIEDYVFNHHVSEDRNDFANWLQDVFKEIDLAKKIAGCKDKKHVQLVLYKHISHKLWGE